jgi:hypothetical protein
MRRGFRHGSIIVLALAALVLAACDGETPDEATFVAQHQARATQMGELRITASVEADRRQVTREFLAAAATSARQRQVQLASTLESLGLGVADLSAITPAVRTAAPLDVQSTATAAAGAVNLSGGITRLPPTPDFRTAPPVAVTPTPDAPPTIDLSAPGLSGLTLATGVGDDNCPLDSTTQFTAATPEIYATAVARNIQAGSTIGARWFQDGVEAAYYDIRAEIDLNGSCVYIFVDQTDFIFTPGSEYSVVWEVNSGRAGDPLRFEVLP